jgi:hypothetical protein
LRKLALWIFDDRLLTRAAQKALPSRDRQEAVYANFCKQVLDRGGQMQLGLSQSFLKQVRSLGFA